MSSVLDIKYKKPKKFAASLKLSLLGGSAHFEGLNKNKKISFVFGARHKTNQYLLNSLDTKADYIPKFSDIQAIIYYKLNSKLKISFLGNISSNQYNMIPKNRETEFGTVNEALKLSIFFEGQEIDKYEMYFGALTSTYSLSEDLKLKLTAASYKTYEQENFDILAEYWLYELNNNLGSEDFGNIAFDRGVGKYIKHARNSLNTTVNNTHQQWK